MEQFSKTREYNGGASPVPQVILPQAYPGSNDPVGSIYGGAGATGGKAPNDRRVTEPQRYPLVNNLPFSVVAAAASVKILAQPTDTRVLLVIQNFDTTNVLWVNFGAAAAANTGLRLVAGAVALFDAVVPQNDVYLFSASNIAGAILYGNLAF